MFALLTSPHLTDHFAWIGAMFPAGLHAPWWIIIPLAAIFARPTSSSIAFSEIESLIKALGGTVAEHEGSRVRIDLLGEQWRCHRPHPGKEAKKYQVEEARELFERVGVRP